MFRVKYFSEQDKGLVQSLVRKYFLGDTYGTSRVILVTTHKCVVNIILVDSYSNKRVRLVPVKEYEQLSNEVIYKELELCESIMTTEYDIEMELI